MSMSIPKAYYKVMHIPFLKPHKESDVIYHYRSVVPEQFLEYALSALGAGDLLVGKDLVIVTVLYSGQKTRF